MPTGIHVFGERARLWSASLPDGLGAVVADEGHFAVAFRTAADRRLAGETFFGAPLLSDLRAAYVRRRAVGLLGSGSLEEQLAALEALGTQSIRPDIIAATPELQRGPELRVLRDFMLASDAVLVRSCTEARRLRELFPQISYQRMAIASGPAAWIAPAPAGVRDHVVVWAPHLDASQLGLETMALAISGVPAAIVCRSGRLDGAGITFATLADASIVLARARLVVVIDEYDGSAAVTFALRGHAVIVPFTSGANEELSGVRAFDPYSIGSLRAAIAAAWNDAPAHVRAAGDAGHAVTLAVPADQRATVARQLAHSAWAIAPSYDLRREAFDRIASGCATIAPNATMDRPTIAQAIAGGSRLRVRSFRELERAQAAIGALVPSVSLDESLDTRVPEHLGSTGVRDAIVIWAPDARIEDLAVILMGVHYEKREILAVCAGGELPGARVTIVPPIQGAQALARALLVIDADDRSPAAARALARLDRPLVVASTSGADEVLDRVAVYDPWDHLSVAAAVGNAKYTLAPLAPRRLPFSALTARLTAYLDEIATDGPRVSVVMLTHNRRNFLRRAVASVAAQRYRNLEVIVVRNGGPLVEDIVAAIPGALLLNSDENLGVNEGIAWGTRHATGKYLAYLADDDAYLPEHIGACAGALERTGAAFAHGGMLSVDLVADGAGGYNLNGYSIECDRPAEVGSMWSMNAVATPAMLIRREDFLASGGWKTALGAMADYEIAMRFMQSDELIYVNRPTIVQSYRRSDKTQYSAAKGDETVATLDLLYATHPVGADQPWVQKSRAYWRERFERHQASGSATPLWYPTPAVAFEPVPYSAPDETGS